MNLSNKLLSDIVAYRTYAKYVAHLGRRESLEESINRNMTMHLDRFPKLSSDIVKAYQRVHNLQVMPSMRALQFSGEAILKNPIRQYNCSFANIDHPRIFSEALYLLLSGVGLGYSVQRRHIELLPKIKVPKEKATYIIPDSIMGWATALEMLMSAYFYGAILPEFDFTSIRSKGSYLVTTGAKAPGPEPLKKMLTQVEDILKQNIGKSLRPIQCHDLMCIISDSVLAGGIRRAALICLFDRFDEEMLRAKQGEWWNHSPWRARANNSAVLPRDKVSKEEFDYIYNICKNSGSGEPGFSWTNDEDMGFNPCHEISLNSNQFCNLTTINQTEIKNEKDFLNRVYAASLLGTLQASYTDFDYLRPSWKTITEKEALLGVSFTGIADSQNKISSELLLKGASLIKEVNEKYAKKLGINIAARTTAIKPEGTSSCVLGSSSGIHARHSEFYIRRIRMNKDDSLATYLRHTIPELVEDDVTSSSGVVVSIPQQSPEGAIVRENETAMSLFNRTIDYNKFWVTPGHRSGVNKHNVSVTISVKEHEWETLKQAMWTHREEYSGISLLPYDGGTYKQAPFESCSREEYESKIALVKEVDLRQIREEEDNTTRIEQIACSGGVCEIV